MAAADFTLRTLLWDTLKARIRPAEIDEIERQIGSATLAANEALHEECAALASILNEYSASTDALGETKDATTTGRGPGSGPGPAFPELPVRNLLENEIKVLARNLRDRAMKKGQVFTLNLGASEMAVFKAVMDDVPGYSTAGLKARPPTRDGSGSGSGGAKSRPASAPVGAGTGDVDRDGGRDGVPRSTSATGADGISEAKLNYLDFESIVEDVQQALQEEHALLESDSAFLTECLEAEHDFRLHVEATIEEKARNELLSVEKLKKCRAALQKLWQDGLIGAAAASTPKAMARVSISTPAPASASIARSRLVQLPPVAPRSSAKGQSRDRESRPEPRPALEPRPPPTPPPSGGTGRPGAMRKGRRAGVAASVASASPSSSGSEVQRQPHPPAAVRARVKGQGEGQAKGALRVTPTTKAKVKAKAAAAVPHRLHSQTQTQSRSRSRPGSTATVVRASRTGNADGGDGGGDGDGDGVFRDITLVTGSRTGAASPPHASSLPRL